MKEEPEVIQKRLQEIVAKRNDERTTLEEKERVKIQKKWKKDLLRRMKHHNPMFDPEVAKRQGLKMKGNQNARKLGTNVKVPTKGRGSMEIVAETTQGQTKTGPSG